MNKLVVLFAALLCAGMLCACGDQSEEMTEKESALTNAETTAETSSDNSVSPLNTDGRAFSVSVQPFQDSDPFRWVQYGDGAQFSIELDQDVIFIIYNGRFLSVGNAVLFEDQIYLPYTILAELGIEQEYTAQGFGTMSFSDGDVRLRIPWAADYYVIEKNNETIDNKRSRMYHNDILYIPSEILEYFSYSIAYPETIPNHDGYTAIVISDNSRVPTLDIDMASSALRSGIEKIYDDEIRRNEADLAEGKTIYSDKGFERMKSDRENFYVGYIKTFGDYFVFRFCETQLYIYVNMYNGEVYYDSFDSLPELCLSNGIMDIMSLYY